MANIAKVMFFLGEVGVRLGAILATLVTLALTMATTMLGVALAMLCALPWLAVLAIVVLILL